MMNKKNPCFYFSLWLRRKEQLLQSIYELADQLKLICNVLFQKMSIPLPQKGLEIGNSSDLARGGGGVQCIKKAKKM